MLVPVFLKNLSVQEQYVQTVVNQITLAEKETLYMAEPYLPIWIRATKKMKTNSNLTA